MVQENMIQEPKSGILCDRDIRWEIQNRNIIRGIEPNSLDKQIQPCSFDFTVGTIFDPVNNQISQVDSSEKIFHLGPGEIISLFTKEELKMPSDLSGLAFATNKQSSRGLLVLNPGHIDPGYEGPLTVKAINLSNIPLVLKSGDVIFTVTFERLNQRCDIPYNSQWTGRKEKESKFYNTDAKCAVKSITKFLELDKSAKIPTKLEIEKMISQKIGKVVKWIFGSFGFVATLWSIYYFLLSGKN